MFRPPFVAGDALVSASVTIVRTALPTFRYRVRPDINLLVVRLIPRGASIQSEIRAKNIDRIVNVTITFRVTS